MTAVRRLTVALAIAATTGVAACGTDSGQEAATANEPTTTISASKTTEPATPMTEPTAPTTFETITERELKLIAKNPADHKDRAIIVHGRVTQTMKDETNGADIAQLLCGTSPDSATWDTQVMIGTESDLLKNIVEGDRVRAELRSTGRTASYTSAIGEISNPSFWVSGISLLDS